MSKFVNSKITDLKEAMFVKNPAIINATIKANNEISMNDYIKLCRVPINNLIFEIVLGGEITDDEKKGMRLKFNKKLPSTEELSKVCSLLTAYIEQIEEPLLETFDIPDETTKDNDDLSIPAEDTSSTEFIIVETFSKEEKKKLNGKKINEKLYSSGLAATCINVDTVMELASIGKKVRKKRNLTVGLIVGGSVIVLGTAAAIAVAMSGKSEETESEIDDTDTDDIDTDIEDIEIEDIPVVDIE
jgi:hypothetical protein